ncbi:MAG TPA: PIG-L family deacetylase [Opitutaceae bacterium]
MRSLALSQPDADEFVPDGAPVEEALARTTHLGIAAHADDLEFFAWHGIAECFQRKDWWFTGIIVTDGAGSPRSGAYADWTNEQMAAARKIEQRTAAIIGGYSAVIQLSIPSDAVKNAADPAPENDLRRIVAGMRPMKAYLHNPADRHDAHVAVFLRSLAALRSMPRENRPAAVYGCEIWRDLDWLVGDDRVTLPAGERPNIQAALAGVFDTQISGGKRYDLAVQGRRLANATFNESHAPDRASGLTLAMNLTPLVHDEKLDPVSYTLGHVERLARDVRSRLERMTGGTRT